VTVHDLVRRLPEPDALKARCRAFAVLDAMFDSGYPTYTFTPDWGGPGVDIAQMSNGSGDLYAIVFEPAGVFLYGLDHESEATPWRDDAHEHWPGLLVGLPVTLAGWAREPAFLFQDFFDATVCAWREPADTAWRCGLVDFDGMGPDPDGAEQLFGTLVDGTPDAYIEYAAGYFERDVDSGAVSAILAGQPLTEALVRVLNPDMPFAQAANAAISAGYAVESSA
jgi:hypothetical protein